MRNVDVEYELMRVTLRIKKIYFDAIRSGDKTYELREQTEFYRRKFEGKKINEVMFHFQSPERIYCEVKSVRLINTPETSTLMKTKQCYKLSLGKVRYESKRK